MVDGAVTNDDLEAIIHADPLDPAGWLIYGDWLQSEGDPRGELVAVQARLARDPGNPELMEAQRAIFKKNAPILLAGLDPYLMPDPQPLFRLSWEFGFIWTANVRANGHTLDQFLVGLRALLTHPSAKFMHALTVGTPPDDASSWGAVLDILRAHAPASLRMLYLGSTTTTELHPRPAFGALGDLSALWPRLPDLEILSLSGGVMHVGQLQLPKLRELVVETSALQRETLVTLGANDWPRLERLELWFGDRRCTCTVNDLQPLFEGAHFPRLSKLALRNCSFVDRICHQLRQAPLGPQLFSLDLSLGALTDMGAAALVEAKPNLPRLGILDVRWHYFHDDWLAELFTVAKYVDHWTYRVGVSDQEDRRRPRVWVDT